MTSDRIKEIQQLTAHPDSVSVMLALKQVWNECEQEQNEKGIIREEKQYTKSDMLECYKEANTVWDEDQMDSLEDEFNDWLSDFKPAIQSENEKLEAEREALINLIHEANNAFKSNDTYKGNLIIDTICKLRPLTQSLKQDENI